ncbi:hypothetical protein C4577_07500 [Candidatus Parcubacteria bacterium]|nr:MAG: hypothetical protein C4577_07500 [Candidatus Parcubacteria bacterium]
MAWRKPLVFGVNGGLSQIPPADYLAAQAWIPLATATASGASSVDFVLTSWTNSDFFAYRIVFAHVIVSVDGAAVWIRTSTDGGSTYDSGASDYQWAFLYVLATPTNGGLGSTANSAIVINNAQGNAANEEMGGVIDFYEPSAAKFFMATYDILMRNTGGTLGRFAGSGQRITAADVDAVRILPSSGTMSGEFRLYGLKNAV